MIKILLITLFFLLGSNLFAAKYVGNPDNYIELRDKLVAGDSLELVPGDYLRGLRISNLHGEPGKHIVVCSATLHEAVLIARTNSNTSDISNSSYITIDGLKFDGMNYDNIDGIKAGGAASNYAHNIHIINNLIVRHGANQQTVGISTKIPCWDWLISHNTILEAGTGLYLGNSDGSRPFVRGTIEFNLIVNPLGYCMQIKHQNNRSDNENIPHESATTIIRHNVFAKDDRLSPSGDRPNLLIGGQPLSGDGSDDRVEIYGNLFYSNPREYLFQGTGNISLHNNVFIKSAQGAMNFQIHNSRPPKNISVYSNTVYSCNKGIHFYGIDDSAEQLVEGNALFTDGTAIPDEYEAMNLIGNVSDATDYFVSPAIELSNADFYPAFESKDKLINIDKFNSDEDFNKDYNGMIQTGNYYGAYSGYADNPGFALSLSIKELRDFTSVSENQPAVSTLSVCPNPCRTSCSIEIPGKTAADDFPLMIDSRGNQVRFDCFKQIATDVQLFDINVSNMESGAYFLKLGTHRAKIIVNK